MRWLPYEYLFTHTHIYIIIIKYNPVYFMDSLINMPISKSLLCISLNILVSYDLGQKIITRLKNTK